MTKILTTLALLLALISGFTVGHLTHTSVPSSTTCTFDGGGMITAGNTARTSDGNVWACTEDGTLVRIVGH